MTDKRDKRVRGLTEDVVDEIVLSMDPPGIAWSPAVPALTPERRKWVADHERLHLQFVKNISPEQRRAMESRIDAFEGGNEPWLPFEVPPPPPPGDAEARNAETDAKVNAIIAADLAKPGRRVGYLFDKHALLAAARRVEEPGPGESCSAGRPPRTGKK